MTTVVRATETIPILGPGSAGVRMSPQEFDAIEDYDDRYRYELVRGVLVVNPIPSEAEGGPNELLGHYLLKYSESDPSGAALDATLPERYVQIADSRRRADRLIWTGLGRLPDPLVDAPTIAVEFVSKGKANWRRDYVEKKDEYLAVGVIEYWVIDRFQRRMTVFRPGPSGAEELIVAEEERYSTPLLPGFELPLAALLASADKWSKIADR